MGSWAKVIVAVLGALGLLGGGLSLGLYLNDSDPLSTQAEPAATIYITVEPSSTKSPIDLAAKRTCRAIERNYLDDIDSLLRGIDAGAFTGPEADQRLRDIEDSYRDAKFEHDCYALGFK